jgi:hypothetical protein
MQGLQESGIPAFAGMTVGSDALGYTRSISMAIPCPTPMHIVAIA